MRNTQCILRPILRMRITIALSIIVALAAAPAARADRRSFVRAYEYATQPKDNLELEIWNEVVGPTEGPFADARTVHRLELEYGLTDHWDLALYHTFLQGGPLDAGGARPGLTFDAWQLESRYRLAEKGEWPVDVMLYLEAERPADFDAPWELEEKLILAKDIGSFGLVANLVAEQKLLSGRGFRMELDLGARYELVPAVRVGVEAWAIQERFAAGLTDTRYFAGPSLSLASKRVWVQIGAGFGVPLGGVETSLPFIRSVLGFNL